MCVIRATICLQSFRSFPYGIFFFCCNNLRSCITTWLWRRLEHKYVAEPVTSGGSNSRTVEQPGLGIIVQVIDNRESSGKSVDRDNSRLTTKTITLYVSAASDFKPNLSFSARRRRTLSDAPARSLRCTPRDTREPYNRKHTCLETVFARARRVSAMLAEDAVSPSFLLTLPSHRTEQRTLGTTASIRFCARFFFTYFAGKECKNKNAKKKLQRETIPSPSVRPRRTETVLAKCRPAVANNRRATTREFFIFHLDRKPYSAYARCSDRCSPIRVTRGRI